MHRKLKLPPRPPVDVTHLRKVDGGRTRGTDFRPAFKNG